MSSRRVWLGLVWLAVSLTALVVLSWAADLDLASLGLTFRSIPVWWFAAMATLNALIVALGAMKGSHIIKHMGEDGAYIPLRGALLGTTMGTLLGQILPMQLVTPISRAWAARAYKIRPGFAIGTSILEQVFEVITLGLMTVFSLFLVVKLVNGAPSRPFCL